MQLKGLIYGFSKQVKMLIGAFLVVLSIGFYGSIKFVNLNTGSTPQGIEENYLGNENDEDATVMKFKKSEREILTIIHNHMLSLSVIFLLLGFLVAMTNLPDKWQTYIMIEPFISVILTFGGIYFLWKGHLWCKYVIVVSGILMTLSFLAGTFSVFYALLRPNPAKNN